MVHMSEQSQRLSISYENVRSLDDIFITLRPKNQVVFVRLPACSSSEPKTSLKDIEVVIPKIIKSLGTDATVIVFGEPIDLVHVHSLVSKTLRYQLWISIKRASVVTTPVGLDLSHHHIGALVYTKYNKQLQHTKTRIKYSYCPACGKTTKDYGGKKHTYHAYGTLISDVWRDIVAEPSGDISPVLERFADLFGLEEYTELRVIDLTMVLVERRPVEVREYNNITPTYLDSQLLNGDSLNELRKLPANSIDFAFADPPYNLKKAYLGYSDALDIEDYFHWCDAWISEVARVLRPGGTFALLNIPLWSIRHFLHLETVLDFQNWIVWDALSFPVRMIMPAHYTILCFSKGTQTLARAFGRVSNSELSGLDIDLTSKHLIPLAENYCLRAQCVDLRKRQKVEDRGILTDVWYDIHRLKHNSRRVDHPCQLPPNLMYRLISLYTSSGDIVLDCFNGAGTTSLAADQLGRRYIGIELEERYHTIALNRHDEIAAGMDPFRKMARELTSKNSPVARLKKQKYKISKKTLQLEVRRVATVLGHLPNREEMNLYGEFPIEFYDEYFSSWGEVTAAARTTGMSETPEEYPDTTYSQLRLF
jgi:DNA modification methylase